MLLDHPKHIDQSKASWGAGVPNKDRNDGYKDHKPGSPHHLIFYVRISPKIVWFFKVLL